MVSLTGIIQKNRDTSRYPQRLIPDDMYAIKQDSSIDNYHPFTYASVPNIAVSRPSGSVVKKVKRFPVYEPSFEQTQSPVGKFQNIYAHNKAPKPHGGQSNRIVGQSQNAVSSVI
jgi:hypothetical protein